MLLLCSDVDAAEIYLNPSEQIVSADSTFVVEVMVDSQNEVINAISSQITYPQDYLEVVDLNYGDSLLTIWPVAPSYDHQSGIINFTGGTPQGSYVFDARILSITFRAKRNGKININFVSEKTSVHLNDGNGTPVNTNTTACDITINTPSSQTIMITSPTHPDEDTWYQADDVIFSWGPRPDSFYSYILSTDQKSEPDQTQETEIGNVEFNDLKDGIYYFILFEKPSGETWQYAGERRIMVDHTPPLSFEINTVDDKDEFGGKKALIFQTTDAMSGIERYDIYQGEKLYSRVSSPYYYQIKNQTLFTIKAYDKAGNMIEASTLVDYKKENIFPFFAIILSLVIIVFIILLFIVLRSRSKNDKDPQME